ncbi:receptor expression-enhancing protein 5-like [Oppia nitens]|uniref:receptor expression-enhancing protein 5-like n=1 Tax=Oppia nitens TaxID=1686743 RepID=UPI0023DAE3B0|nr:receptor expression-enhancing protein 5-like [Oppia nitens]
MGNEKKSTSRKSDKWLNQSPRIKDIGDKIEKTTGVKRVYVAQGIIGLTALYMIFGYFAELLCNAVGFVYPAYASIKALESPNKEDDTKWLTYWVVFALFSVVEFFSDVIFSWFPLYWLVKVVFLVWCFLPFQNNGSTYVYTRIIRPFFLKNRPTLDSALSSAAGKAKGLANEVYDAVKHD